MTLPAFQTYQVRCHHCHQWIGESSIPLDFSGMFRDSRDCALVEEPRSTYRCKHCGWVTVFRPAAKPHDRSRWRAIELKAD